MKRLTIALFLAALCLVSLTACGSDAGKTAEQDKRVVIWTSGEDYKNEYYLSECRKQFPDYDITLEYMNTSSMALKVMEEGEKCSCDILLSEEYGYLDMCADYLVPPDDFDFSIFLDELLPESRKYTPECKNGGCVALNPAVLAEKGLPAPTSYEDLLNPMYQGLISMPSPATSGTGYMFLRQLTNEWGEDAAFDYFEKLTKNVLQYTASGSGAVNLLTMGETAVALGMTGQAVREINDGVGLEIVFFDEGSPYSMYGNAILAKSADRQAVRDVFRYLATDLCRENNERFFPEQVFKDFTPEIPNFPTNIRYGDMSNDTLSEKERLLEKWTFS